MKRNEYVKRKVHVTDYYHKNGVLEVWFNRPGGLRCSFEADTIWFNFNGLEIGNVSLTERGRIIGD